MKIMNYHLHVLTAFPHAITLKCILWFQIFHNGSLCSLNHSHLKIFSFNKYNRITLCEVVVANTTINNYLYNPHRQTRFFCQLLPNMSCRFWSLVKCCLQDFQLFCFDCCSWSPSFGSIWIIFINKHSILIFIFVVIKC